MHDYSPLYSPFAPEIAAAFIPLIVILAFWTIVIKGYALWNAARGGQKWWFIALLVINTVGLLEIVYLVWFRSDKTKARHKMHHTPAHSSQAPEKTEEK